MREMAEKAQILYDQGRYEDALKLYHEYLVEYPDDVHALCRVAHCYLKLKAYGKASEYAGEAIAAAPDFGYGYYTQAFIYSARNLHEDADRAISTALELEPTNADFLALAARLRIRQNEWLAALDYTDTALEYNPGHADALIVRSSALIKLRRFEEASDALNSVLELDPENEMALMELGYLHLNRGAWKESLECFQHALAVDPESEYARSGLMEALRARYPVYGVILIYFLWMQRFSQRNQQMIMYGATLLARAAEYLKKSYPVLAPFIGVFLAVYRVFAYLTWTVKAATTLLLRFNRYGRELVSRQEIVESNIVGVLWGAAGGCFLYHHLVDPFAIFCRIGVPVFLSLPLLVAGGFASPQGWPRQVGLGITAVEMTCAVFGLVLYTWHVPLGLTLLMFYFNTLNFALLALAMLESAEPRKD